MDDKFLHELRREPTPAFSRRLRAALDDKAERQAPNVFGAGLRRYLPLAASLLIVSVAFTFPTVRAGAQAFLDMFRVVNFVPVQFDGSQLQQLANGGLDLPALIADDVEALTPPTAPVSVATLEDAGAMAGIDLIQPAWLPVGYDLTAIQVGGGYAARIHANTSKHPIDDRHQRIQGAAVDAVLGVAGQQADIARGIDIGTAADIRLDVLADPV